MMRRVGARAGRQCRWLVALLLAACSGGSEPEVVTGGLTAAEATALAAFVASQPAIPAMGESSGRSGSAIRIRATPESSPQVAPGPFTIDRTMTCAGGGSVHITGSGTRTPDQQKRETAIAWTPQIAFANCVVGTGSAPVTIAQGSLSGSGNMVWRWPDQPGGTPTLASFSLTRSGTLHVVKGERGGSCSASLATVGQGDQFRTTGTVCDKAVENAVRPPGLP